MILLIRHCTPKINYNACNHLEAKDRINEYNTTHNIALEEIIPFKNYIAELLKQQKSMSVYCSPLPRALLTAKAIFCGENNIIITDDFKEFNFDIMLIPLFKFRFRTWLFISRILWFLGILKTNKSFEQEKSRSLYCATILSIEARNHLVVLVGLFNSFVEKYLRELGHKRTDKIKNSYSSVTKFEKYK